MAKRHGAQFWRAHVEAWHRSDLMQAAYCAAHGLSTKSFYRWRHKQGNRLAPVVRSALDRFSRCAASADDCCVFCHHGETFTMRSMVAPIVSPSVFFRLLAIVAVLATLSSPCVASAKSTRLSAGDWRAIQFVIAKQADAFRLDDGEVAFSLASPGVRRVFESVDNFMEMVRTEYGAV